MDNTSWTVGTLDGNYTILKDGAPFMIKGVCYAPAPINYDTRYEPALGDFFWDTFQAGGGTIWNWYCLWGKGQLHDQFYARGDIGTIKGLNANALRIYACMSYQLNSDGSVPAFNPDGTPVSQNTHHFTHKQFLDMCLDNGIHVIADIPMPAAAYKKFEQWPVNGSAFWEAVLNQTSKDLADHPAVIGFNIMNEQDQDIAAFPDNGTGSSDANTDYFYSQCVKYAGIVKRNAPDKLVGWALHDVPQLLYFASKNSPTTGGNQTYLEMLAGAFDYWGVNTYQTVNLDSLFGTIDPQNGLCYSTLPEHCRKPVVFMEFGWPATGRDGGNKICSTPETQQVVADTIDSMYGQAYGQPNNRKYFAGAFYFEFADEWWKNNQKTEWNGGGENPGRPNGWDDEEGFGIYGISRTAPRTNTDPNWAGSAPVLPQDTYTPRMPVVEALQKIYGSDSSE